MPENEQKQTIKNFCWLHNHSFLLPLCPFKRVKRVSIFDPSSIELSKNGKETAFFAQWHTWLNCISERVQSKPGTPQENDTRDDLDAKEEGYCTNSEVMTNVTLRGGISTGRFRDRGKVPNMKACVEICCISKTCDVAFLLKNNCFSVTCFNERLCEAVRARSSIYIPKIVYIYARTKSDIVAPTKKRRNKRLKRRTNEDQFTEVGATNFKRRVGKDRFKRQVHRKAEKRNRYKLDQRVV